MTRGPLRISITERGQVDSLVSLTLTSRVEGTTTIISIVPEGTQVRQGDLVCELDSALLRERAKQQEITVTQAEAALRQAEENVAIQKTQNESDIAAAELRLTLARLDLEKYTQGEYLQLENEIAGQITLASEEHTRAEENFDFTRRLSRKGYRSQNDVEADRIAVMKAEIALRVAQEKQGVLQNYTRKRTVAELEANARELQRELERVTRKATAALTQFEADYAARKLTAEVEREKYQRLLEQIEACQLTAPQDGEVVYANQRNSFRGGGNEEVIEEGAIVRERQAIVKLPDVTRMKVDARIHESKIGMVRAGLPVVVRIDAYPGEVFQGVVDSVSSVPSSTNWFNRDLKEYEAVVRITEEGERVRRMRPGLTAVIEIVSSQRANVLQVPMQAIVSVGDQNYAFVRRENDSIQRRTVLVGQASDTAVEVRDGLQEGEQVVLHPRTQFADELSRLAAEQPQTAEAEEADPFAMPSPGDAVDAAAPPPAVPPAAGADSTRAGPPEGPQRGLAPADHFPRLDRNGDGRLAADELPGPLRERLADLDRDGDGGITREEWDAFTASRRPLRGGQPPPE